MSERNVRQINARVAVGVPMYNALVIISCTILSEYKRVHFRLNTTTLRDVFTGGGGQVYWTPFHRNKINGKQKKHYFNKKKLIYLNMFYVDSNTLL